MQLVVVLVETVLVSLVVLVEAVLVQDHLVMVEQELKALVVEEVAVLEAHQEEWVVMVDLVSL
tara:strand:+ start:220 stop:408 length:189 start_codon:yes stop_codon:yes gene_type:complete